VEGNYQLYDWNHFQKQHVRDKKDVNRLVEITTKHKVCEWKKKVVNWLVEGNTKNKVCDGRKEQVNLLNKMHET
jgi:hypothetical protein